MAGSSYCHGHNKLAIKSGGAPAGNKNAARPGSLYSKYLSTEEQELIELVGCDDGLEEEIKLARVAVSRLLAEGEMEAVGKALLVVSRLIAEHRKATGDQATGIVSALTTILSELGLGEGGLATGLN